MASVRETMALLALVILALFVASTLLKVSMGIGFAPSLIDTAMSGLQMDYTGLTILAASNWQVLLSKILDALMLPLLAILAAAVFFGTVGSLDIRERVSRSRIRKLHNHAIIVPFNNYAEEIAKALSKQGVGSVVMAKTRKGLARAMEKGLMGVVGDIDEPDGFIAAGIGRASFIIACDYDDMRNAITAITARAKSKTIKVVAIVNDEANSDKMEMLKVNAFVTTEAAAGEEIADGIMKNAFVKGRTKE